MPSPFPGIDPWLEGSAHWQGFQNSFVTYLRDELRAVLPRGYRVSTEVRVYFEREDLLGPTAERVPDVEVYRRGGAPGTAVLERPVIEEGVLLGGAAVERREAWLAIRSLPNDELVTALEVLSPSNKRSGDGRAPYRVKQEQLAASGVNLVEIDMVRGGQHTVRAPAEWLTSLPPYDHLTTVYRAAWPAYVQVIHWTLRDPLPVVPIPLDPSVPEPRVDLQPVYARAYENGDLAYFLRHRGTLAPPVTPADEEWARSLAAALPHETATDG
jgi:hypothetical protein